MRHWFDDGDDMFATIFPMVVLGIVFIISVAVVFVEKNGNKERDTWVKAKYSLVWDSENLEYVERKGN